MFVSHCIAIEWNREFGVNLGISVVDQFGWVPFHFNSLIHLLSVGLVFVCIDCYRIDMAAEKHDHNCDFVYTNVAFMGKRKHKETDD